MIFVEQTESRRVRRQSCNSDQVRKEKREHEEQIRCRMSLIDCATAQGEQRAGPLPRLRPLPPNCWGFPKICAGKWAAAIARLRSC